MPDGLLDGLFSRPDPELRIHVCRGPHCSRRGSEAVLAELERTIAALGLGDRVEALPTTCRDRCDHGPSVNVYPGPTFYSHVDTAAIGEIVRAHLEDRAPVERLLSPGRGRR